MEKRLCSKQHIFVVGHRIFHRPEMQNSCRKKTETIFLLNIEQVRILERKVLLV